MVACQDLLSSRRPLEDFRAAIPRTGLEKKDKGDSQLPLHLFEWSDGDQQGRETQGLRSIETLQRQNTAAARVM